MRTIVTLIAALLLLVGPMLLPAAALRPFRLGNAPQTTAVDWMKLQVA